MTSPDALKALLEAEAGAASFQMPSLLSRVAVHLQGRPLWQNYDSILAILGTRATNYVLPSLLRASFLIELVNSDTTSTKMEVRWADRLKPADPRYATFDDCFEIFAYLVSSLVSALADPTNRDLLSLLSVRRSVAYEIPVDYHERRMEAPIHRADNIDWIWDELPKRVVALRSFLIDKKTNPYAPLFAIAYNKIRVKTYLTDRVLTGVHKTNREKRWETHPRSVHFASRRSCLEIENILINQLCHFEGFPVDLRASLEAASLLLPLHIPFRCPITLDPMSFTEFEQEINDPQHGKASFQVGHLNPLKAITEEPRVGHTAANISWVSSDGNRIQGSLSLEETRALITRIFGNYQAQGFT